MVAGADHRAKGGCAVPRPGTMLRHFLLIAATTAGGTLLTAPLPAEGEALPPTASAGPTPEAIEFFEARVRPVLVENCLECHGEKRQKGGLRLDSKEGALRGAEEGPVIVAGHPEQSPMIRALRHEGDIKMPPRGKLPEEAIEALTTWVRMGAPWPDAGTGAGAAAEVRPQEQQHWAFRPVHDALPPAIADPWVVSPVDAFVLAKLSERGMHPAPEADRRSLIRRVSFDLTGLPPTPAEVDAFVSDASPDAYEKLVDRLLASPRYGERWARHWLDVARYSDTKGYVFEEERRFPYSYTYRDWVIRAFNEDLPYDRFVIEQLAADLLEGADRRELAAMGFLTLGRRFLNNEADIIDDRIDVTMRGIMALTVSCARCHDHKFDPIPTADYYSLYGVFASATEPKELPLIAEPEATEAYRTYEKEVAVREAEVTKVLEDKHRETVARLRKTAGEYLVRIARQPEPSPEERRERGGGGNVAAGELNPMAVRRWREYLKAKSAEHHRVWAPWNALAAVPAAELPAKAGCVLDALLADKEKPLNDLVAKAFGGEAPKDMEDVARRYGEVLGKAQAEWESAVEARKKANEPALSLIHI